MKLPPDILAWALSQDNYSKDGADYTTTEILKPPQITYLAQKSTPKAMPIYKGYMSLMGTGVHKALEEMAPEGAIVEKRLFHEFEIYGEKVTLGGKPDYMHEKLLNDYKVTLVNGKPSGNTPKEDHYKQGLINCWLAHKNGIEIDTGCVEYIFRDWSPGMAERQSSYPQKPNMPIPFKLPDWDDIERFIRKRLTLHVQARKGVNTPCTDDERWKRPDVWALKKPTNKKARKLCKSADEALENLKQGEKIEFRAGSCVRCESWCEYGHVCPQNNKSKHLINA